MHEQEQRRGRAEETEVGGHLLVPRLFVVTADAEMPVQALAGGHAARLQVVRVLDHRPEIAVRQRRRPAHGGQRLLPGRRPLQRRQPLKALAQFVAEGGQIGALGQGDLIGLGVGPARCGGGALQHALQSVFGDRLAGERPGAVAGVEHINEFHGHGFLSGGRSRGGASLANH